MDNRQVELDHASDDLMVVAELASACTELLSEEAIYTRLAQAIERVVGSDCIISVSNYDAKGSVFTPQALLGIDRSLTKPARHPVTTGWDLTGPYPDTVTAAMASGRLTRVAGAASELTGPAATRGGGPLVQCHVYVIGFDREKCAGGVCIITPHIEVGLRAPAIEALTRIAALGIERKRSQDTAKRLQAALHETEMKYRSIFEHATEGIFQTTPEGRCLSVNPAFARMFGYASPEEMVAGVTNMGPQVYVRPAEREHLVSMLLSVGTVEGLEAEVRRRDGSTFWISINAHALRDEAGNLLCLEGTNTDITQRKRAEEALRQSEANYRLMAENVVDIVAVQDMSLRFTYVSPSIERVRGFSVEEALAQDLTQVMSPESLRLCVEAFADERRLEATGTANPKRMRMLELEEYCKDGSKIWVEAKVSYIRDQNQRPVGIVSVTRDISERKRAEAEREKLQAQLLQVQKMEAVGRLAGGVAHDFNNMLGAILGNTELALAQLDPSHPVCTDLQEVQKAAERSAELTRQLLAFASKQTIAPRILDLNETIAGTLKMLQRLIGEDIDLAWVPQPDLWPVRVDPSQLDQVLVNLCVNARDAVAGVGKVTLETANCVVDESYCSTHAEAVPGEYVLLSVSDNGCGIGRELLDKVFEPFFTTKGAGRGTGLGLATVHGVVKQNGGFVTVYSEPGRGTIFKIHLPRPQSRAPVLALEKEQAAACRQETILLVEDEPAVLKVGKRLLEKLGYTVLAANTPGQAIRLAEQHAGAVHLLMTDVVMPEMNGRELAKRLLSLHPGIRCLFTSGYTANVIAHHGVLDQDVHFLAKPFSERDLAVKVREAIEDSGPLAAGR